MKNRSIRYIPFTFPGIANVHCAFQTRRGGNIAFSAGDDPARVAANRESLRRILDVGPMAELEQVHGDEIIFEPAPVHWRTSPHAGQTDRGDGLATRRRGLALLIRTADCQPLLLAHRSGEYIAALHVGWRGNRRAFPVSGTERFCRRYGLDPGDVLAVRGPSLSPPRAEFVNFDAEWGKSFRRWFDSASGTVDLWGLTRSQLLEAGLAERHIYGIDLCTADNSDLFFSYRREKTCGRQASLIWIGDRP
ncbi:MAG: polyphenol oxidase family protein [Desulfovibrio sp.]|jgi:YfiH family protein|nr:polyphenol oxidase family protein [Desulfovibrio sp.]